MKFLLTTLLSLSALFEFELKFVLTEDWQSKDHYNLNCSSGAPLWLQTNEIEKGTENEALNPQLFDLKCLDKMLWTTICYQSTDCKLKAKKVDWISGINWSSDENLDQNCTYNCCHSELIRVGECVYMGLSDALKIENTTEKVIRDLIWNKRMVKAIEVCNATFVPFAICPRDPKADPLQFKSDPSLNPAGQSAELLILLGLLGLRVGQKKTSTLTTSPPTTLLTTQVPSTTPGVTDRTTVASSTTSTQSIPTTTPGITSNNNPSATIPTITTHIPSEGPSVSTSAANSITTKTLTGTTSTTTTSTTTTSTTTTSTTTTTTTSCPRMDYYGYWDCSKKNPSIGEVDAIGSTATIEACKTLCMQTPTCVMFEFEQITGGAVKGCWLKDFLCDPISNTLGYVPCSGKSTCQLFYKVC